MKGNASIPLSGLPITLSPSGVSFGKKSCTPEFEVKTYKKFQAFFNLKLDKNKVLYYIYRNCYLFNDAPVFKKHGVRYDLTLIKPGKIGNQPVRTVGHLHKIMGKMGRPAEIYQVLSGSAIFLFHDTKTNRVYAVRKNKGGKIIIPPQCAHITINASPSKPLLVSDIFINFGKHDYNFFKKTRGPAWYPMMDKKNRINFEKNILIKKTVPFSWKKSKLLPFGLSPKKSLYKEYVSGADKFSFLWNPKMHSKSLSIDSLFK